MGTHALFSSITRWEPLPLPAPPFQLPGVQLAEDEALARTWMLSLHLGLLAAAALAVALGIWPRLCTGLYLLLFLMVELWDKAAYLNHYYLVSLVALWSPHGGARKALAARGYPLGC